MTTARDLAYGALIQTERGGAYADAVLGRELERCDLEGPDRGLATLLVYGTLARRLTLDHTISRYSRRDPADIDLEALVLLRMGLFQLAFLDRVPAYAAVDTTVRLARRHARGASGFVNAVLRRVTREGMAPIDSPDPLERAAVELSHPVWLVKMWRDELGADTAEALMAANNEPMPTVLRALGDRDAVARELGDRGVQSRPATLAPQGLVVSAPTHVGGLGLAQGEASQLAVLMTGAAPGESVLDACAAPGGKTAYLAALVGESGTITAVDPGRNAARRIRATTDAAGVGNVEIVECAIEDFESRAAFDLVVADAPCSGLGTLRQHPEIRWRRQPSDLANLATRQRSILAAAAGHVRPGGRLLYSTCTVASAENDDIVDSFLTDTPGFEEDRSQKLGPAQGIGADGRLRTFPHEHGTDGFFAALLRRRD